MDSAQEPNDIAVRNESVTMLINSLSEIPKPQSEAIVAHYLEQMSVKEIANSLGVPVNTIETRIRRGTDALRRDAVLTDHF